jgi:mannose-1-phosphate guanylyltransferase
MTLGIRVDHPATEYGYLVPFADRRAEIEGLPSYPLRAFEEKPLPDRARELVHEEGVAWNAGMFLWRRRAIRAALEQYTDLTTVIGPVIGSQRALAAAYERLGPTSIDYAVMEPAARAGRVVMGSMDVGWSDLGGWPALLDALGCRPTGRVLPAGEAAELGPGDLLVERRDGRLAIVDGPRGSIRSSGPTALLAGAVSDRPTIEALLARVAAHEVHP